jgi:hypothetical protein
MVTKNIHKEKWFLSNAVFMSNILIQAWIDVDILKLPGRKEY